MEKEKPMKTLIVAILGLALLAGCTSTPRQIEISAKPIDKPKLVLRATPRQMTRYSLALDILMEVDKDVSDNPRMARKLLWLRANRFKWTQLAKQFGYHRTTIKKMYETILDKLSNKLKNNLYIFDKIFK